MDDKPGPAEYHQQDLFDDDDVIFDGDVTEEVYFVIDTAQEKSQQELIPLERARNQRKQLFIDTVRAMFEGRITSPEQIPSDFKQPHRFIINHLYRAISDDKDKFVRRYRIFGGYYLDVDAWYDLIFPYPRPEYYVRFEGLDLRPEEEAFLDVLCEALDGKPFSADEITERVSGELRRIACKLCAILEKKDREAFWKAFDHVCLDWPDLNNWRTTIDPDYDEDERDGRALPVPFSEERITGNEARFIDALRGIVHGRISSPRQIRALAKGDLGDLACDLYSLRVERGDDAFWVAFEAITVEYPNLERWRYPIRNDKAVKEAQLRSDRKGEYIWDGRRMALATSDMNIFLEVLRDILADEIDDRDEIAERLSESHMLSMLATELYQAYTGTGIYQTWTDGGEEAFWTVYTCFCDDDFEFLRKYIKHIDPSHPPYEEPADLPPPPPHPSGYEGRGRRLSEIPWPPGQPDEDDTLSPPSSDDPEYELISVCLADVPELPDSEPDKDGIPFPRLPVTPTEETTTRPASLTEEPVAQPSNSLAESITQPAAPIEEEPTEPVEPAVKQVRAPYPNEQAFIDALRDILAERVSSPEEFASQVKGELWDFAYVLYQAYQRGGVELFWSRYDALCDNHPHLARWRALIDPVRPAYVPETPAEPLRRQGTVLSDVELTSIVWYWQNYLAKGKVVLLDGDPGQGKSTLLIEVAARITTGKAMPDGSPGVKGGVIIIMPEDGLADTIVPRFAAAGADPSLIVDMSMIKVYDSKTEDFSFERPFRLESDLAWLEEEIRRVDAKLLIIDPLMEVLGGKDVYRDTDVREALGPLKLLVQQTGLACVMVRHLTKGGGSNVMYRGSGSIGFAALSRLAFIVVPHPHNPECYVLAQYKSNIGKCAPSITYRIVSETLPDGNECARVEWGETIDMTAQQLLEAQFRSEQQLIAPKKRRLRDDILDVLQESSPEGKHWKEIQAALAEMGVLASEDNMRKTLQRMMQEGQIEEAGQKSCYKIPL